MKLLVVIPSLARGGAERVVSLLTQEWAKAHDVELALFDSSYPAYPYSGELVDLALPAAPTPAGKVINAFRRIFKLAYVIRRSSPDQIISFMESANFPVVLAGLLTGTRERITISVHNNPYRFPISYRILIPWLYRLPREVVAVSAGVRDALVSGFKLPKSCCHVIPNPIDLHAVKLLQRQHILPHSYQRWMEEHPTFLAVGRLHPQKGFDRLIQAMTIVVKNHKCQLMILGEGPERKALESQIHSLGLTDYVLLPGVVDNPFPYYAAAIAFVLPSRHEGWPMVLVEAMACGCPVISFVCPYGPDEIIEDGVSGLLVAEGDVEGLARAMERVLQDKSLRKRLGGGGIERVKRFDVREIAKQWLA